MPAHLKLAPRLVAIHAQEYPRFSGAEMARRRAAVAHVMEEAGVDHLLVSGEQRTGTGVVWLTGWPATVEAYVIVAPREPLVPPRMREAARATSMSATHTRYVAFIEETNARGCSALGAASGTRA